MVEVLDASMHDELGDVELQRKEQSDFSTYAQFAPVDLKQAPAVLTFSDITVKTMRQGIIEPKVLLHGISGTLTGGLWGIMGGTLVTAYTIYLYSKHVKMFLNF